MAEAAFDDIYRDVPEEQREQLRQFRATHPYKRFAFDGLEWRYIASGQGEQAVLILGGGISTGESSFRTITRLEGEYRILSPSYPSATNVDTITEGLAALLDREGIEQAHIFGHSLGAGIAHVFVRSYPQRVDKLILSGFGLYRPWHTRLIRLSLRLPYCLLYAYYGSLPKRLLAEAPGEERAFVTAYFQELFASQQSRDSFLGRLRLLLDIFDHADAYRIFTPVEKPGRVLIIAAADDWGFSRAERNVLKASYPGAQVHIFRSGGHWVGFTHRDEYDTIVDAFLRA